mgnify:FL=1
MKRKIKCKRQDRTEGHPMWHYPHAAEHCRGVLCKWQKAGQASRCPMKRSA